MTVRLLCALPSFTAMLFSVLLLGGFPAVALAETETETETDTNTETNTDDVTMVAPPLPRVAANPHQDRHQALQRFLREQGRQHEIVSLIANETEFYGLFLRESRGKPQGGILLLHDQHQHGHWPTLIAPLREHLPPLGWTTLAIELTSPPPLPIPERGVYEVMTAEEPSTENLDETDPNNSEVADDAVPSDNAPTSEPLDSNGLALTGAPEQDDLADNEPALPRLERLPPARPWAENPSSAEAQTNERTAQQRYEDDMHARIEAAMRYLQQHGQLNLVIIATGDSANWAAAYVQKHRRNEQERGLGLVLVDAMDDPWHAIPLTQQLSELDIPLLDVITALNRQAPRDNQRRAGTMRHKQREQYQQLVLPAYDHYHHTSSLLNRRVQGWLRSQMKGSEFKTGQ